ncbi:MAG: hypothetical protein M3552_05540 [Planctomycetota bacterium]|nr:hypothetical protein [Planctomycetota bacterium]
MSLPEKPIVLRYFAAVTYHAPQTKNWRNIITERRTPTAGLFCVSAM